MRGRSGYVLEYANGYTGLVWNEPAGVAVMVQGDAALDELLAVAAGLEFVSEARWQHHFGLTDADFEVPVVTTALPG